MRFLPILGPRVTEDRIRALFGNARPVRGHIWEAQFDGCDRDLHDLARTPWDELFTKSFWAYFHDLSWVELQRDVFAYLFPACLVMAQRRLVEGYQGVGVGDSDLMSALSKQNWQTVCTRKEIAGTQRLLIDGMLDRLDRQSGFHDFVYDGSAADPISRFNWIGRFNSLGYILPSIESLWTEWWAMQTPGQAIAAVEYTWGLASPEDSEEDPDLPYPINGISSEPDGNIFFRSWEAANQQFLAETLTYDYFVQKVEHAISALEGCDEQRVAINVRSKINALRPILEQRIEELVASFAQPL